jgi:release factor glutamine methyltransferase
VLIREVLQQLKTQVPAHEAELLVLAALEDSGQNWNRFDLQTRGGENAPAGVVTQTIQWAKQRQTGIPLQHLTGRQAFLDHTYQVSPAVLIPRPETEVLATLAIEHLRKQHGAKGPARGWEVGLGSGILSIELLYTFPRLHMWATEVSPDAQAVALKNSQRILQNPDRLRVLTPASAKQVMEPFTALTDTPQFLISNPPYLLTGTEEATHEVAQHEPALALFAPASDVLHFYRRMAEDAPREPGFHCFLELPHERAEEIAQLFLKAGWETQVHNDLNGRMRVLVAH